MDRNIGEIVGEFILLLVGLYVIMEISKALNIAFGSLVVGAFIIVGVTLLLKEIT